MDEGENQLPKYVSDLYSTPLKGSNCQRGSYDKTSKVNIDYPVVV